MRLLVITQKVDQNDSNLGFFHTWLKKLAGQVEHLYVICLSKGEYHLPANVTVVSLGKEQGSVSSIRYAIRFYACLWRLRGKYDNVFVHMNPEYCILGGPIWRLWNKKVLLWYTHKSVNLKLRLAEKFVNKIFTASKESFRLPSKKVEVTGHGIEVEQFLSSKQFAPLPESLVGVSLLGVGRITSSKDWETVIRAVAELRKNKALPRFTVMFVGDTITKQDEEYKKKLYVLDKELAGDTLPSIGFKGVMHEEINKEYQAAHLLIHTSQTGSVDKVVLEALAAGRIVVTSSAAYAEAVKEGIVYIFPEGNSEELAKTIEKIYQSGILAPDRLPNQKAIEYVRKRHNLDTLIGKIINYFTL